jgi:hypothetical protein
MKECRKWTIKLYLKWEKSRKSKLLPKGNFLKGWKHDPCIRMTLPTILNFHSVLKEMSRWKPNKNAFRH